MGLTAFNRMRRLKEMQPENIQKEVVSEEIVEKPIQVEEEKPVETLVEEPTPTTRRRRRS